MNLGDRTVEYRAGVLGSFYSTYHQGIRSVTLRLSPSVPLKGDKK